MEWIYYSPEFECDQYNRDMLKFAQWSGHRRFIYDFIANMNPELIVELGSFYGCSAFAMAQAIKDFHLQSKIYAVDIWKAFEDYTSQSYVENIYASFMEVRKLCGFNDYIITKKMTFEEARGSFNDKTVDVIHIDGSHYYDDVKRDFQQWVSALKDDGFIIFHDIADNLVNGKIMGSHIFWEELKKQYKYTLEFKFSCGLGILCFNKERYERLERINFEWYQRQCNLEDALLKDEMCRYSFIIRNQENYIKDLQRQLEIKDIHLGNYKRDIEQLKTDYEHTIKGKDHYIMELEKQRADFNNQWKDDRRRLQMDYEQTIQNKDDYIKELEDRLKEW